MLVLLKSAARVFFVHRSVIVVVVVSALGMQRQVPEVFGPFRSRKRTEHAH